MLIWNFLKTVLICKILAEVQTDISEAILEYSMRVLESMAIDCKNTETLVRPLRRRGKQHLKINFSKKAY